MFVRFKKKLKLGDDFVIWDIPPVVMRVKYVDANGVDLLDPMQEGLNPIIKKIVK